MSIVTENGVYRQRDSEDGLEGKKLVPRGRACDIYSFEGYIAQG